MDMVARTRASGFEIGPALAGNWRKRQEKILFRRNELNKSFRINKILQKTNSKTPRNDTNNSMLGARKGEKRVFDQPA